MNNIIKNNENVKANVKKSEIILLLMVLYNILF